MIMTSGEEGGCDNGTITPNPIGEDPSSSPGVHNNSVTTSGLDLQEPLGVPGPSEDGRENHVKGSNESGDGASQVQKVVQEAPPHNVEREEAASPYELIDKPVLSQSSPWACEFDDPFPPLPPSRSSSVTTCPMSSECSENGMELSGRQSKTSSWPGSPTNSEASELGQLPVENPDGSNKDQLEKSAGEKPEKSLKDEPEETPEHEQEESSKSEPGEPTTDEPDDLSDNESGKPSKDELEGLSDGEPGNLPKDEPDDLSDNESGKPSKDELGGLSDGEPGNLPKDEPDDLSNNESGKPSKDELGGLSDGEPGNLPKEEPEELSATEPKEPLEEINDDSVSRREWIRQKRDENAENSALDKLMRLIGLEHVKSQFLSMKAAVDAARRRNETLDGESLTLTVKGNKGTGKALIEDLFKKFKADLNIPPRHDSDDSHYFGDSPPFPRRRHNSDESPLRSKRTVKLNDYSDEELHGYLKRIITQRFMEVEGGVDGSYTSILARRVGRGRGTESFQNMRSIKDALAVACDRQADRLQQQRILWAKNGKRDDDEPNDRFLTKEDLLGPPPRDSRPSSGAYHEFQAMAGLKNVKKAVEELMDIARRNYNLELRGKEPIQSHLNRVFLGPPGAGKTTVAKLFGQIVVDMGLVSKPEVVVKDPSDFTSMWVGGAQQNTHKILEDTQGKVLIIDDAHGLCPRSDMRRSTSNADQMLFEILNVIVAKTSTEPGQDRCIILVGYAEQMHDMFYKCNPGLRSRFPLEDAFEFRDYEVHELMAILDARLAKDGITASDQARDVAKEVLTRARDRPAFGNGRDVHNLVNRARTSQKERSSEQQASLSPGEAGNTGGLTDSLDADFEEPIMLEPQDFDPHWNRASRAGQNCKDLFKDFVGFDSVIEQFQGYQQIVAGMRLHEKDPRPNIPFTFVFKGPPGTGKTSTARKVGQIFYDMGFLSSDDVFECSATDLIGQYLGHTGPMVQSVLEKALGKVLFIDEAYRLGARGFSGSSFEEEVVGELVDSLTKPRYARKIVIILAGYSNDMDLLMKSNRGLRGRFATEVIFPQLTPDQCMRFLGQLIGKMDIIIRDRTVPSMEKKDKVYRLLTKLSATRDWANGRDIETLAKIVVGEVFRKEGRKSKKSARLQVSTDQLIIFLQDMLRGRLAGELQDHN